MIDIMPQKLISKNDLNNWSYYSNNIGSLIYVKKYLQDVLKYWVENIGKPLSIPWVLDLFEGKLDWLDKKLGKLEERLKEDNLEKLLEELQRTKPSDEANKKIFSLEGEIFVFRELSKKYKNIKKIEEDGDWEYNNTIGSVKSKLCLDFNYRLIENTLRGLFFIKENDVLRNYNYIRLGDRKNIGDKFRQKIICFLEEDLNDLLSSLRPNYILEEMRLRRDYYDDKQSKDLGYLLVNIYECGNSKDKGIEIIIKEDRPGEPELNHKIEIILEKKTKGYPTSNIPYDTDSYWVDDKIDPEFPNFIKDCIEKNVGEFDESFEKVKNKYKNKYFEGWINIAVHAMHENYIIKNSEEIQRYIGNVIGTKDYKIHVAFQFGLEPIVFSFFKGVAQRS